MKKNHKLTILLITFTSTFTLTSCATLFAGGDPKIRINGENKEPITIITERRTYTDVDLPYLVRVNRHHIDGQRIQIQSENYKYRDILLQKSINGWAFGNIIFGGLIGWGIDLITNCVSEPSQTNFYIEGTPKE